MTLSTAPLAALDVAPRIGRLQARISDTGIDALLVTKLANEKITKNKATVEARKTFGVGKGLRIPYI